VQGLHLLYAPRRSARSWRPQVSSWRTLRMASFLRGLWPPSRAAPPTSGASRRVHRGSVSGNPGSRRCPPELLREHRPLAGEAGFKCYTTAREHATRSCCESTDPWQERRGVTTARDHATRSLPLALSSRCPDAPCRSVLARGAVCESIRKSARPSH
jgi:hypothetical protein